MAMMKDNMFTKGRIVWTIAIFIGIVLGLVLDWLSKFKSN